MSSWLTLLPWMHEYKTSPSSDEEDQRYETTRYPNLSRIRHRSIRHVLILLSLGMLAHSGSRLCFTAISSTLSSTSGRPESTFSYTNLESYSNTQTGIDWSKFAYAQYVTDKNYLCNSLMIFESLHRLGSRAERLMMYPEQWVLDPEASNSTLLRQARDNYNVRLVPIRVQHLTGEATWSDSFTKLLAFNQTQYERVISLDSDANVLKVCDHRSL
jgi:alpha-N-acetylglucosamine transferase